MVGITAVPYARIENQIIQSDLSDNFDTITLSDFTISYGRSTLLDQPSPARLRIGFLVRKGSPWLRRSLAESGVQVWIRYGNGSERRQFIGRIRDAEVSYLHHLDGAPLYRLDVSATDTMADLERVAPAGLDRGTESARSRLDYLQSRASGIVSGIRGPAFRLTLAPKNLSGSLLSEITAIFNSGGEALWYDPHTHRLEARGRVANSGFGLTLLKSGPSRYSVSWRPSGTSIIRISEHKARSSVGIRHGLDQVITSVMATGKRSQDGQWIDDSYSEVVSGGNGWGQLSIASEGYATYANNRYEAWGLAETARFWIELVKDARMPVHPPVTTEHTEFDTERDLLDVLSCREAEFGNYLAGSVYTSAVPYLMIQRAIGGTVNYKAHPDRPGKWTVERTWTNLPVSDIPPPVTGKTINPSNSEIVRFRDLDETVTGNSLQWTTKGV